MFVCLGERSEGEELAGGEAEMIGSLPRECLLHLLVQFVLEIGDYGVICSGVGADAENCCFMSLTEGED